MAYPTSAPTRLPTVARATASGMFQGRPVSGSTTDGSAADWLTFQPAMGRITSEGIGATIVSSATAAATPRYPTASYIDRMNGMTSRSMKSSSDQPSTGPRGTAAFEGV